MNTFFIADTHFGHQNSIILDNRPWRDVEDMDTDMIMLWNSRVMADDYVYVIGDFAYRNKRSVREYVNKLHGHIHLVRGNHDRRDDEYEKSFCEVSDYMTLRVNVKGIPRRVICCHFFIPFYLGARKGAYMLHGHTHKSAESAEEETIKVSLREKGFVCEAYNVGCMWQGYVPQTLDEIINRQPHLINSNINR